LSSSGVHVRVYLSTSHPYILIDSLILLNWTEEKQLILVH